MKKMMKKVTVALLALVCLPMSGLPVLGAELPEWYHGFTQWEVFEGMEPINDYGMLGQDGVVFLDERSTNGVIIVYPHKDQMYFVLREDVDEAEAIEQIAEVMEQFFPGFQNSKNTESENYQVRMDSLYFQQGGSRYFSLRLAEIPESISKLETCILVELARRHLISEFYGFGSEANYITAYFPCFLECYPETYTVRQGQQKPDGTGYTYDEVYYDWNAVQAYLDAHYSGYIVEQYVGQNIYAGIAERTMYRIVPNEELTPQKKVEIACELWKECGLDPEVISPASDGQTITGHNALERPGDTNLDCEVNILDVISVNKFILGVGTLDKTGLKNADMDGNGTADSEDSLAILKKVLQ